MRPVGLLLMIFPLFTLLYLDKHIDLVERTFNKEGSPSCNERNAFFSLEIQKIHIMHGLVKMNVMC